MLKSTRNQPDETVITPQNSEALTFEGLQMGVYTKEKQQGHKGQHLQDFPPNAVHRHRIIKKYILHTKSVRMKSLGIEQ